MTKKIFFLTILTIIFFGIQIQIEARYPSKKPFEKFAKGQIRIRFTKEFYQSPAFNISVNENIKIITTGSNELDQFLIKSGVFNIRETYKSDRFYVIFFLRDKDVEKMVNEIKCFKEI